MFLGIKLSNLTRDKKKFEGQKKIFLPNFAEYLSYSTRQNKICRVPGSRHSAKYLLCRVTGGGTRQRLDAVSPPNVRRTAGARAGHVRGLCRVPPGQHSAKETLCRVPCFADGRHSVKPGHAVCQIFAECPWPGTRQITSLPSARSLALGKGRDTRQRPRHSANLGFSVVCFQKHLFDE